MNTNWFEMTVKYPQTGEDGVLRNTTHHILIDAINYTEAEKRAYEETTPFAVGSDIELANVARRKYVELFADDSDKADKYYHCAVAFITLDEKTMQEKRQKVLMLVQADNIDNALANLHKGMSSSMIDYDVVLIKESPIEDVYHAKLDD